MPVAPRPAMERRSPTAIGIGIALLGASVIAAPAGGLVWALKDDDAAKEVAGVIWAFAGVGLLSGAACLIYGVPKVPTETAFEPVVGPAYLGARASF